MATPPQRRTGRAHLLGWALGCIVAFTQPWGLTSADTKHDLVANPSHFLAQAAGVYSTNFTMGQLQNQAYGYLFPQGPFFLATEALPDWIAQRLWWTIVLGVGFSGFYLLARRAGVRSRLWAGIGAVAYMLSPRALTTLTAISSETWPVMLAPWVVVPFLSAPSGAGRHPEVRVGLAAAVPVALMGAVNATATLAACVPALIVAVCRRRWAAAATWLAACAVVSAWWIGPLLILGRYAAPFTEFIESAFVTTRWLNLPEILRGTTSWTPFVDTERQAGTLLATEPVFIMATIAVAAVGVAGLARCRREWSIMLAVGIAILACRYGWYLAALDGALAPLRNLHKFDSLVRLPLCLGVAVAGQRLGLPAGKARWLRPTPRHAAGVLVLMVVAGSIAPALSSRLLPQGAYERVPEYWQRAADYVNEHAAGTRTLIYPPAASARQDWGWTRDEPAQPLLDVPWAVRDAIPLIPPETIRGLDGLMAGLKHSQSQEAAAQALARYGIGAVILRDDLEPDPIRSLTPEDLPGTVRDFGEVSVVLIDTRPTMRTTTDPVIVAGGGESLAMMDAVGLGTGPARLAGTPQERAAAEVVTDTPLLVDRNYGTLTGPVSGPLAPQDPSTVNNRLRDYPSAGRVIEVDAAGGQVAASSSESDASSFGGADPARSVTAAVDGYGHTAWWPTPGQLGWIELRAKKGESFQSPELTIEATGDATVLVEAGDASVEREVSGDGPTTIRVPGGRVDAVRVSLKERVGIAELSLAGHPIRRTIAVPDHGGNPQRYFFQRMAVDTAVIIRSFSAAGTFTIDAERDVVIDGESYLPGDVVTLDAGRHELRSRGWWVSLSRPGYQPAQHEDVNPARIGPAPQQRILATGLSFNEGLRAELGGLELDPVPIDADMQGFILPAGASGALSITHEANGLYRGMLAGGAALGIAALLAAGWIGRRVWGAPAPSPSVPEPSAAATAVAMLGALALVGWPALTAGAAGLLIVRFTTLSRPLLSAGLILGAGAMLARAPWPTGNYAGDSVALTLLCAAALGALVTPRSQRAAGASTNV